jgi:hypothetical protein
MSGQQIICAGMPVSEYRKNSNNNKQAQKNAKTHNNHVPVIEVYLWLG